jgi:hypothetical protein
MLQKWKQRKIIIIIIIIIKTITIYTEHVIVLFLCECLGFVCEWERNPGRDSVVLGRFKGYLTMLYYLQRFSVLYHWPHVELNWMGQEAAVSYVRIVFLQWTEKIDSITTIYLSIYLWLYSPCGPWPPFQFLNLYTVGRTPWAGDRKAATYTQNNTNTK